MCLYQTEAKLTACDNIRTVWVVLPKSGFFKKQMKNAPSAFAVLTHWVEREKDKPPTEQSTFFSSRWITIFFFSFEDWQAWSHQACATCPVCSNITQCLLHTLWSQAVWSWKFDYVKSSPSGMCEWNNFLDQDHSEVFYWLKLFQVVLNIC